MNEAIMIIGFMLAAYSIVGNDSLQTLGTFLYSNSHRKWWILWIYTASVMTVVILYGWFRYDHDPSYDRLNKVYGKSIQLEPVNESIDLARDALAADPVQERLLEQLDLLETEILETKEEFITGPAGLDRQLLELQATGDPIASAINDPSVPNAQLVAIRSVQDKVKGLTTRIEERRDVSHFIKWTHLLPPLALLLLTRYGFPVSTSFLVLVTFQPAVLSSMLTKSLSGYVVAFFSAILVYTVAMRVMESRWRKEGEVNIHPIWILCQWCTTAFLWSMWLIQDMANIFVYFPRMPDLHWLLGGITWMILVQGFIFHSHGGKIQKVVTSKTNTHDIRSATVVDMIYGSVLLIFKISSNIPMSTTWVFLGLLAGREIAFALSKDESVTFKRAFKLARKDMVKAGFGLGVSVAIAFLINYI